MAKDRRQKPPSATGPARAFRGTIHALAGLVLCSAVGAQSAGGEFEIPAATVDGGGDRSTAADFELAGTIGQADAGLLATSNASYSIVGGLWGVTVEVSVAKRASSSEAKAGVDEMKLPRCVLAGALLAAALPVCAQTSGVEFAPLETEFTYQGRLLVSGTPADGDFDFLFRLFAVEADVPINVLVGQVFLSDVAVSDGVFTVQVDFGAEPFDGRKLFLEVSLRDGASDDSFETLLPRQELTAAPYALYAEQSMTAMFAESVPEGSISSTAIDTSTVQTRVSGTCDEGSSIRTVLEDGTVECEVDTDTDTDTTYDAGSGLSLAETTFSVDTEAVQARVTGRCDVGQYLRGINVDGSVLCEPLPTARSFNLIDALGGVGKFTGIAVGGNGLPVISYYDDSNQDLKVASCSNSACTASAVTTVDSGGEVGRYTSIAIGVNGLPVIAYLDETNLDLKAALCSDAACATASVVMLDGGGEVGAFTSIAIGADGYPIVSYFDEDNEDLKVARCLDAACTSAAVALVDSGGNVGAHSSIAIGADGLPVISYLFDDEMDLKVARCNDPGCAGSSVATVDSGGEVGRFSSIAIGSDMLPVISYFDDDNEDLKVAHCIDAGCSASTLTIVDSAGNVGWHTSLVIGADGLPLISYFDDTNSNLKVAHCEDELCSASTLVTLDSTGNVGQFTSIAIGADDNPVISYYDLKAKDLKVAKCGTIDCL